MKKNIFAFLGFLTSVIVPFAAADIKTGPEIFILPVLGIAIIAAFIAFAVSLIIWIIRKIKSKKTGKKK
jgi:hypothetical protein